VTVRCLDTMQVYKGKVCVDWQCTELPQKHCLRGGRSSKLAGAIGNEGQPHCFPDKLHNGKRGMLQSLLAYPMSVGATNCLTLHVCVL